MKVILTLQILKNSTELWVPFSYIDSFVFNKMEWLCVFTKHTTQKSIRKSQSMSLS